jgi:iron complex transport system ATP-binding protein
MPAAAVVELERCDVRRRGSLLLRDASWRVEAGEHWALLGPNGAGKTTLLRIAAARSYPSSGRAAILGETLGRYPVQRLHERIGLVDADLSRRFDPSRRGLDVVLTGATGTIALLADRLGAAERERATELLALLSVEHVAERALSTCSAGERARLLLARALMARPALLLLDEPTAGLDLAGRELVIQALDRLAAVQDGLATVTVTHHVEELPATTTHVLMLRGGAVLASGPASEVMTAGALSACFGIPLELKAVGGRYLASIAG